MYDIIPFLIILFSVLTILFIFISKFPALANLDIGTIKAEKETKFKEQIISNRLKRNVAQLNNDVLKYIRPIWSFITDSFRWLYARLHEMRDRYKTEPILSLMDIKEKIDMLFAEIDEREKKDDYDEVERCLIEIIGLESQNIRAFKLLGQVYLKKKNYDDAEQTFEHILRLLENEEDDLSRIPGNDQDFAKKRQLEIDRDKCLAWESLSFISQNEEDFEGAITNIRKALLLEPNNPRLLDTLLEISIIIKDKVSALDAHERMSLVNPENQKLEELMGKIKEL